MQCGFALDSNGIQKDDYNQAFPCSMFFCQRLRVIHFSFLSIHFNSSMFGKSLVQSQMEEVIKNSYLLPPHMLFNIFFHIIRIKLNIFHFELVQGGLRQCRNAVLSAQPNVSWAFQVCDYIMNPFNIHTPYRARSLMFTLQKVNSYQEWTHYLNAEKNLVLLQIQC